jgi:hypothetical protein
MSDTQVANLLITLLTQLLAASPQIAEAVKGAKDFIVLLFGAKLITAQQQDALYDWVDAQQKLVLSGVRPAAWTVDPDPQP